MRSLRSKTSQVATRVPSSPSGCAATSRSRIPVLALDPNHLQAHLRLAVALGYIAEGNRLDAHLEGLAHEAKALLDRALTLAPYSAWAHGLLGVAPSHRHARRPDAGGEPVWCLARAGPHAA